MSLPAEAKKWAWPACSSLVRFGSLKMAKSPTPEIQAPSRAGTLMLVMMFLIVSASTLFFFMAYSRYSSGVLPGRQPITFLPFIFGQS